MKTLDIEAVQAFVLVADLTSFTRAAEAMGSTQSAISLKIKRLESGLGKRLLDRTPRLPRAPLFSVRRATSWRRISRPSAPSRLSAGGWWLESAIISSAQIWLMSSNA